MTLRDTQAIVDTVINEALTFETSASVTEAVDKLLATGKHKAKKTLDEANRKVRQTAGALGFLRGSSVLSNGLKDAALQYTAELTQTADAALGLDGQVLSATLQRQLGDWQTDARILVERETSLIKLEGERQRSLLGLEVERDVQQIDLDSDKAAALVRLDYKEQEMQQDVAAEKILELLKTTEENKTIKAVNMVELASRKNVQQIGIQGEYDAEQAKFDYEKTSREIKNDARLTAAIDESHAKLTASSDVASARYIGSQIKGQSRVDGSRQEGEADLQADGFVADHQLKALGLELSTKEANQIDSNTAKEATFINESQNSVYNKWRIGQAELAAAGALYSSRIENDRSKYTTKLEAIDRVSDGRLEAINRQGQFDVQSLGIKLGVKQELSTKRIDKNETLGRERRNLELNNAIDSADYAVDATEGKTDARSRARDIKNSKDLAMLALENAATMAALALTNDAKLLAVREENLEGMANQTNLSTAERSVNKQMALDRLDHDQAVMQARLDAGANESDARMYAFRKSLDAQTYSRGKTQETNAKIQLGKAQTDATIRGYQHLYSEFDRALSKGLEVKIANETQEQVTVNYDYRVS